MIGSGLSPNGNESAPDAAAYAGIWVLYRNDGAAAEQPTWRIQIHHGGFHVLTSADNGGRVLASGTYAVSDGQFAGSILDPPRMEGRVEARLADGMIDLDLIQFRKGPARVTSFIGLRL